MSRKWISFLCLGSFFVLLNLAVACNNAEERPLPTIAPTLSAIAATDTPAIVPTFTQEPTAETIEIAETATPFPTVTVIPTSTPLVEVLRNVR